MEDNLATRTTAPMLFCVRCANMLYPEGTADRQLIWRCSLCNISESHDECQLVHVLNLKMKKDVSQDIQIVAEAATDPTAQRDPNKKCPKCGEHNVVCSLNPLGSVQEDMTLFFACPNPECRHVWSGKEVKFNS
ncbi:DNA-directed RNA polymerase II subunit RPB9 [Angomonas deanei]|uniref:DNA-directed RNA polymerase subunit n=1 Tax=Angomonas deanei TaxID=59799 RepID=S9WHI2_9TRYP|nr:DNA-directed RNA polymerase II subunit RPB9 [Angomonas deanei]EPY38731.1 DNA-directed RNA polymerase II subunit RPB9 [Angomonas deanei]EPY40082.1 DNA-directed RNA polymerase II subunit RPB9 [Angomonas deanei]CAD2219059.1 Transcription factor S-II (TFIIS), putative [Angomonas deanei]|eukprot:EPY27678.1 DNA-directed RNA polymerase II subunit RPB9 [Angomonas deanei]